MSAYSGVLATSIALQVMLAALVLYGVYWVVRKGVAHGIRDARRADLKSKAEPRIEA